MAARAPQMTIPKSHSARYLDSKSNMAGKAMSRQTLSPAEDQAQKLAKQPGLL